MLKFRRACTSSHTTRSRGRFGVAAAGCDASGLESRRAAKFRAAWSPFRPTWGSCRSSSFQKRPVANSDLAGVFGEACGALLSSSPSGVSHPGVTGGHAAEKCFLTDAGSRTGGFRNWVLASLVRRRDARQSHPLSFAGVGRQQRTAKHAQLHPEPCPDLRRTKPRGTRSKSSSCKASPRKWRPMWRPFGRCSTLDFVSQQANRLNRSLSKADQQRLDQYFTAVANWNNACIARKPGNISPSRR